MWIVIIILGIVIYVVVTNKESKTSLSCSNYAQLQKPTHSSDRMVLKPSSKRANTQAQAKVDVDCLVEKGLEAIKKMLPAHRLLREVLVNNLQCVPKSVLEMEFTQTAIQIFILHYASMAFGQTILDPKDIGLVCKTVMEELYDKGVLARKEFDPNLDDSDPIFKVFPMMIKMCLHYPPKDQTMLLVAIEKHMESKLGHRVRYIGKRPTDNPLNISK